LLNDDALSFLSASAFALSSFGGQVIEATTAAPAAALTF
jgi:hypothetical protein